MSGSENKIREASLRYLERRQHSERELFLKLRKKGFSPDEIQREIERLRKMGLLNDREFAINWAIGRRKKLYGRKKIIWELRFKGISDEIVEEAIHEAEGFMGERETAERILKKRRIKDPGKAYRFLLQRGFPSEIAAELAAEVENEITRDKN